jgi:hypothetical protein
VRRFGIFTALGVIVLLGLLPASADATPTWSKYSWEQQRSDAQWMDYVVATVDDSDPSQSWKSIVFQVDGTPSNSILASNITLSVGSTTDTTDCSVQAGTNALEIACNNLATGFLSVGKTMTLSFVPNPVIHVNVGGYFLATDFANQSYGAAVSGPTDVTIGKPFITNSSLTGLKTGHPHLAFKLHHGVNAPAISRLDLNFLHGGLTIGRNEPRTVNELWNGGKWPCTHSKLDLFCDTSTPVDTARVTIAYPVIRESSGLKKKTDEHPKGTYKVELKVNGKVVGTVNVPIH